LIDRWCLAAIACLQACPDVRRLGVGPAWRRRSDQDQKDRQPRKGDHSNLRRHRFMLAKFQHALRFTTTKSVSLPVSLRGPASGLIRDDPGHDSRNLGDELRDCSHVWRAERRGKLHAGVNAHQPRENKPCQWRVTGNDSGQPWISAPMVRLFA
jgi:hypothetical protein